MSIHQRSEKRCFSREVREFHVVKKPGTDVAANEENEKRLEEERAAKRAEEERRAREEAERKAAEAARAEADAIAHQNEVA